MSYLPNQTTVILPGAGAAGADNRVGRLQTQDLVAYGSRNEGRVMRFGEGPYQVANDPTVLSKLFPRTSTAYDPRVSRSQRRQRTWCT